MDNFLVKFPNLSIGLPNWKNQTSKVKKQKKEVQKSYEFYLTLFEEFPALIWRANVNAKCDNLIRSGLYLQGGPLPRKLVTAGQREFIPKTLIAALIFISQPLKPENHLTWNHLTWNTDYVTIQENTVGL
jgi:hypothetical protein